MDFSTNQPMDPMDQQLSTLAPSREQLVHSLYEAAELEHCLMCTYLYAAASLKTSVDEGLSAAQAETTTRWRRTIIEVAIEEMSHLAAVWNITSALGGTPRFGRANFPLDPGALPAGIVVKLAPFNVETLQHFIHLERPLGSTEADGEGFAPERQFIRGSDTPRLTPMAMDYQTVGEFYIVLSDRLRRMSDVLGDDATFCGDRGLQLTPSELKLAGAKPVLCLKTALQAFDAIVQQGEGSPESSENSHYARFAAIRSEYRQLLEADPAFVPGLPAATNPVLRRPPRPEGRVWLEDKQAIETVDLANACYGLMLRLLAYAYVVPGPSEEKSLAVDLATCLMRACTPLAEHAARLPSGPSNPQCHAGMSYTALRDAAPLAPGPSSWRFFGERMADLARAGSALAIAAGNERTQRAAALLASLATRTQRAQQKGFASRTAAAAKLPLPPAAAPIPPVPVLVNGVENIEGSKLTLLYEGKRCIHARFCVTGAPKVFLANVQGPWIHPDAMDVERLADIAHACPSGAIRYQRKDGRPNEEAPPVNLIAIREGGPYAVRGPLMIEGEFSGFRATLCRCGASKNKPYCDSSHHDIGFHASGEPQTGVADTSAAMLELRDGDLAIEPEIDGPLQFRGNLEITSGTGRVVSRVTQARLCRCGASNTKPFCDNSHARIGFRSS
ncbi:MAG: CDGSH-type iron sulfur-containing protein [Hydrocarboniphaga sp.]|uniref:ferritin-like domain-containing protein n=1 Tax=Hydrocarboniphaga sp. TaxID=2033016 RepID=UPI002606AF09|nr:ferritin-like domain-containing protein [Hydrocarboniphaga sp.]MDB5971270.1 CDGSH-type iron sulfur-containing protein [Hydrocarboniphaga sp.]